MSRYRLWRELRKAGKSDRPGIERRQRERLVEAVAYARTRSRYYQELYAGLTERVPDPTMLPVTDKRALMARFDDWVTDPDVTLEKARGFAADSDLVGAKFLDTYLLTTTSGTTGTMGIFLHDEHTRSFATVLVARAMVGGLPLGVLPRLVAKGGRSVKIAGTGGHFLVAANELLQQRENGRRAKTVRLLSAQSPLPELVAELDAFRPAIVESYASIAALLATEQQAGRLHIDPVLISLHGEGLPEQEYGRIAQAFGARVYNGYGCNECLALSFGCQYGWHHINEDWVIFEPVDADYRPTPPGEQSHTALLSVLYRREQPILRYDLGDSVVSRPDPCPCGSPFLAVRVRGRASAVLTFHTVAGDQVPIVPPALETAVERTAGIELFQIVRTAPTTLRVRLLPAEGADQARIQASVRADLTELLADHGLHHVTIEPTDEPPQQIAGGKYPTVIPG